MTERCDLVGNEALELTVEGRVLAVPRDGGTGRWFISDRTLSVSILTQLVGLPGVAVKR